MKTASFVFRVNRGQGAKRSSYVGVHQSHRGLGLQKAGVATGAMRFIGDAAAAVVVAIVVVILLNWKGF